MMLSPQGSRSDGTAESSRVQRETLLDTSWDESQRVDIRGRHNIKKTHAIQKTEYVLFIVHNLIYHEDRRKPLKNADVLF